MGQVVLLWALGAGKGTKDVIHNISSRQGSLVITPRPQSYKQPVCSKPHMQCQPSPELLNNLSGFFFS